MNADLDTLAPHHTLDLERYAGRTPVGVAVRVLQRILALTAAIWHNDKTGQASLRSLVAYDHCDDLCGGRGDSLTLTDTGLVPFVGTCRLDPAAMLFVVWCR